MIFGPTFYLAKKNILSEKEKTFEKEFQPNLVTQQTKTPNLNSDI